MNKSCIPESSSEFYFSYILYLISLSLKDFLFLIRSVDLGQQLLLASGLKCSTSYCLCWLISTERETIFGISSERSTLLSLVASLNERPLIFSFFYWKSMPHKTSPGGTSMSIFRESSRLLENSLVNKTESLSS